jgi:hypothetical protein
MVADLRHVVFRFFVAKCENAEARTDDKVDFVVSSCFRFFIVFEAKKRTTTEGRQKYDT